MKQHPFRYSGPLTIVIAMTDASVESEEEPPGKRKYCTLSPVAIRRLERLAKGGSHGSSVPRVMTSLIEEGIRLARKDSFLTQKDWDETAQTD